MPIKNYTTQIKAEKTVSEIQAMLAKAGAQAVLIEYGRDAVLSALSFKITTPFGLIAFRLPANIDSTVAVLRCQKVAARLQTKEQAARVAWRIIKDWVAAQLALVETEMVSIDEVFLPYALTENKETVYERVVSGDFKLLPGE